ncbi:FadR/GntR family transcriptional regulator [Bifidobacterium bifidum]|uniref:FadR/GntR family transcriptional regulator n=1 Tax=Bifidobacterium bifidum TaxID=1681 RepID=UPI000641BB06|nr:FCD domain-containing protein [Bifidobacterium bifidum]KLN80341.1 GntR family transcriptional regulator [Bifidobacterium bifidum]MCG4608564.1 FCD domain-containing protein [Bifidobacterium bifidum]MCG4640818.1 FCD domain-containing protein [Bifidobacterium bifidum]MDB1202949.1 FCD domain-containing protein [Bifidobacterium bifidum]MDB1267682.1 FCD domain-containing protein [Bifidobacterium bifidum]
MAAELGTHRGDHTQDVVGAAARSLPGVKRRRGGRRGDAEFQRRFDVSRTVAREVAKSLETAKVVTVRRRIGLVSQPVKEWDALSTQVIHWKLHSTHRKEQLRTLTELRLAIEPAAATSAARYAPIDVKSRPLLLAAELRHTGENGRLDEFHKLDIEFHSLILRNSGNEMFASLSTIIATVLSGRVELHMYPQKPKPEALDAHDAVAQAIWQSSPDNARQAMHRIVDEVAETLQLS